MSDWKLVTGEVTGKCAGCQKRLSPWDIVYEWRARRYHDGCLLDLLTSVAPADPYVYSPPGADWQAP